MIGRWSVVDPLAENHHGVNPYNYTLNNPLLYTDPMGMDTLKANGGMIPAGARPGKDVLDYGNGQISQLLPEVRVTDNTEGRLEFGENAMDAGGALFGAARGAVAPGNGSQWLGNNGKYYPESWGGNGATGSRAGAFKAAGMYRWAGRAAGFGTVVVGGLSTYDGYQRDGGHFGVNAQEAAAGATGAVIGGWAGAQGGAAAGAAIGVWFGGAGAIPGAIIGGAFGGYGGSEVGKAAGTSAINYYHKKK